MIAALPEPTTTMALHLMVAMSGGGTSSTMASSMSPGNGAASHRASCRVDGVSLPEPMLETCPEPAPTDN